MTPEQQAALRAQIYADPACADALGAKDCAALSEIVSAGRTRIVKVPIADVQAYLQSNGLWWNIKAAAADAAHVANAAAVAVMDVAGARYENIDLQLPIVAQMFGGLVLAGLMTQQHIDDLQAMGVIPDPCPERDIALALYNDDGSAR